MPSAKRKTKARRGRSKSKGRKRKKSAAKKKVPKTQQKVLDALSKYSPYDIQSMRGQDLELFAEYKPLKPLKFYDHPTWEAFSPHMMKKGGPYELLSKLPKKSDDPYLDRLLAGTRQILGPGVLKKAGETVPQKINITDVWSPPILDDPLKDKRLTHVTPPSGGAHLSLSSMGQGLGMLPALSQINMPSMFVPIGMDPLKKKRRKTLDELTYKFETDDPLNLPNIVAVQDNKYGVDPYKDYMLAERS